MSLHYHCTVVHIHYKMITCDVHDIIFVIVGKIHGRKFMTSCDTVLLLIFVQKKIYGEGIAVLIIYHL